MKPLLASPDWDRDGIDWEAGGTEPLGQTGQVQGSRSQVLLLLQKRPDRNQQSISDITHIQKYTSAR